MAANRDHVESDILRYRRATGSEFRADGYQSYPGIAKNLARENRYRRESLKTVPASMLGQLPYYPGYEWKIVR